MKPLLSLLFALSLGLASLAAPVALTGCEREGPFEETGEQIDESIEETGEEIEDISE